MTDMPVSERIGRSRTVLGAIAMGLALAGCASTGGLAPTLSPNDPDQLAASRSLERASNGALSSAAFPQADWWTTLGDAQLDALVREALQGNPSLAAADARVRQAQAQAGLVDAERKPGLSASAQYTGVQLPETLAPAPVGGTLNFSTVLMLNFKWSPDLWGGQRAKYEAAVGQVRAAEVDAQAARLTLSAGVARAYVGLAQAFDALDVADRETARATHLLSLGQQRVKAGIDNQMQLRQSESLRAAAQQQAQAARQQIDTLRNALAALLGQGPDRGLAIERPHLLDAPSPAVPSLLPSELLGHRPDVVAARWRVESASRGIDSTKAAFKPSVNLSGLVGLAAPGLADLFSSDALLGFGGPALSLPIFSGERLRSTLAKSDADYDLAVAAYDQTLVDALRETTDALQSARALDAQLESATRARDAAAAAWKLAGLRYQAGLANQLDVLAAQQPLLRLDQQLAMLRAQRYLAAIDLDRALGGGLDPVSPTPDSDLAKAPTP